MCKELDEEKEFPCKECGKLHQGKGDFCSGECLEKYLDGLHKDQEKANSIFRKHAYGKITDGGEE